LINCYLEEILGIIYQLLELSKKEGNNNNSKDEIKIYEKIIPTFSQDLIFYPHFFSKIWRRIQKQILSIYSKKKST